MNDGQVRLLYVCKTKLLLDPEFSLILVVTGIISYIFRKMDSSNPYSEFVHSICKNFKASHDLPLGQMPSPAQVKSNPTAPKVLLLAPHPDDECVMGGLPLRLMREAGSEVLVLPITCGSNPERKKEREKELNSACKWIGFSLLPFGQAGLDNINPESREAEPAHWSNAVDELVLSLEKINPDILFFPSSTDWNRTHLGVYLLTIDALQKIPGAEVTLIETEFWGQIQNPNLMVENSPEEVADLVAALSHHKGEVTRNPFHLRLPAWMQDNVRRGAEVVGGQGGKAPDFDFATLYKVSRWKNGKAYQIFEGGKILSHSQKGDADILNQLQ